MIVTLSVLVLVILDLLVEGEKKRLMTGVTVGALVLTLVSIAGLYPAGERSLFEGMMALDAFSLFFKMLFVVATILAAVFSLESADVGSRRVGEFYALLMSLVLGGFLMASATDLLMMYLALEMVSIPSYLLAGFQKEARRSNEAAIKYVIYGGVSSGVMIYGLSLLYGMTGTTNLYKMGEVLATSQPYPLALFVGVAFAMAGFGYKVASVPFHFWCPDVYEGAPTPVTAFLSIAPKAAGFAMLARFFYSGVAHQAGAQLAFTGVDWPFLLAVIAAFTMTLGNVVAVWQDNLKRLLAYSSIAHAGYMLMGVVTLSGEGLRAMMFYLMAYLLMNLGAFLVVILMARRLNGEDISAYKGLGFRSPFVAVALTIFLFSLTGLPPTAGLIGKVYLFAALIEHKWYWLAVIGVLNGVVALYYYARIVRAMFLEQPATAEPIALPGRSLALLTAIAAPTVLFGVYWTPLIDLADRSMRMLTGP
jgi:NADH-quinone oxidoreductase subunit N